MLEALQHGDCTFATLTYENTPDGNSLKPEDVRDWLKLLRRRIEPQKIRYFLVGEYGDVTSRPHYHVALFGYGNCRYGRSQYGITKSRVDCCDRCDLIRDTWGKGHIYLGELNESSASYVAAYVTKKLTNKNDERVQKVLGGRYPEFARMSLKPGIGAGAVSALTDTLTSEFGSNIILQNGDVPLTVSYGRKTRPLGRYLREKLRERLGFHEKGTPKEVLRKVSFEKWTEYDEASKLPKYKTRPWRKVLDKEKQKVLNMEKRYNLYTKNKETL